MGNTVTKIPWLKLLDLNRGGVYGIILKRQISFTLRPRFPIVIAAILTVS